MNSKDQILSLIPQRPPFVMIDKILVSDEAMTRSSFVVRENNIFVENELLKEPGLVENIAQTAAARAGYNAQMEHKPVQVGYIAAIKNLQIKNFPKINDELITEISIENQIFNVSLISGKITCNEQLIAQCEMKIFISNQ
jgi:3-hydroxymyristoyl/3-hydroxydecanoyl-(acyl carrier protein) dehydratase